jgi:hypothetical protein
MQFKKIISGFIILFCCFRVIQAQPSGELKSLQEFVKETRTGLYDTSLRNITYRIGNNINYLYPLYQLLGSEKKFREQLSDEGYYDLLGQNLARVGDYSSALAYEEKATEAPVSDVENRQIFKSIQLLKNIKNADARKFISFIAGNYQVIMLNEAPSKPLHRAFAISLLNDLHKRGFRWLAMEMLNPGPDRELSRLTYQTGHYTTEPVAGEMVRIALDMGFKLLPYEDADAMHHTARERDSVQAQNIFRVLQADSTAKIFVFADYGHIAEKTTSEDFIPMGMAFKKISGIDPLTIDQTDMTEGSNFSYGNAFYNAYLQRYPVSSPSIALSNDEPVNITGSELYDLTVIHPKTTYRDSRPTWLSLGNRRQPVYVKASNKNTFLVQAYYQFESFSSTPGQAIPADQTWLKSARGNYLLFLKRGKYILLFRDMRYKTLYTQHIEVN